MRPLAHDRQRDGGLAPHAPGEGERIERVVNGIVRQLGTFNLLYSVFHEWIGMAQDMWAAPWRHKLSYLLREPGWSHDGSRETSAMIRARWEGRQGSSR